MSAPTLDGAVVHFGVYDCSRCGERYIVNDGTWRLCTADFCHACFAHLKAQYALIPVDKNGKDIVQ